MAKSNYSKTYSNRKITYSNKQKEDTSNYLFAIMGGFVLVLILVLTVGTIVIFAPAILITSCINFISIDVNYVLLLPNQLWGSTLLLTIIMIAFFIYKFKKDFWKAYLIVCLAVFVFGVIYSLFFPKSILILTVIEMYPYLNSWFKIEI